MKTIIKGGHVIDPANKIDGFFDLLIEGSIITACDQDIPLTQDTSVIDAHGKLVVPGLVDMHVHLREPGREDKETIATGCMAAVAGGVTSLACMPNTTPVNDNKCTTGFIRQRAREVNLAKVYPIGAISKGLRGEELSEMAELREAGVVGYSDDGKPATNSLLMRRALEYAKIFGAPIISHCEDISLSADGQIHEGFVSTLTGLQGIPREAEEVMVARDIILAKMTKSRLHIAHVSSAKSVDLIRQAKKEGVFITAEVTPHHFSLTEEMVFDFNTNTKVNPPLRTHEDIKALIEGLSDGTIDAIATDHAPHTLAEKEQEYTLAPFGVTGLETLLSVSLTSLYHSRKLDLTTLISKLTCNPARLLGIPAGTLSPGAVADICIIDLDKQFIVETEKFYSKGKNCPFKGQTLCGLTIMTLCEGKIVYPLTSTSSTTSCPSCSMNSLG